MKIPKHYKRVKRGVVRKGDLIRGLRNSKTVVQIADGLIGESVTALFSEVYRKPKRYEVLNLRRFGSRKYAVVREKDGWVIYGDCTKHYAYKALKMLNGES